MEYEIGSRWECGGESYILTEYDVTMSDSKVCLVGEFSGNRWSAPITVSGEITDVTFARICGGGEFVPYEPDRIIHRTHGSVWLYNNYQYLLACVNSDGDKSTFALINIHNGLVANTTEADVESNFGRVDCVSDKEWAALTQGKPYMRIR
jgi:hypothetical protein